MKIKLSGIVTAVLIFAALLAGCGGGGGGGGGTNPTYSISVSVSGLAGTVVLQDNGTDDLSISANGAFTFGTKLAGGAAYNVTVKTQPTGLMCRASNNTGTISGANVTNVSVVCTWTKQLGVSGVDTIAFGVAADSSGNVYVAGYTYGGLDGNDLMGFSDFFVTKYDPSGTKVYTNQLGVSGGVSNTNANGVAVDSSGNVYVAGATDGQLGIDPLTGTTDFFVTKYDPSGTEVSTKQRGVSGVDTDALGVAVDSSDNVYVAGYTDGALGSALTGTTDFFVTKYNSSGTLQYTKQLGVSEHTTVAFGVAVDSSDNVYVAGYTDGALGSALTGTTDFFVTKYNSAGTWQYTKQLGVSGHTTVAFGVAADSSGNVYVAGATDGGLDGNTLTGTTDFFVTKYNSAGTWQYTKQLGVSGVDTVAYSVAVDSSGNVYVAGYTDGGLDGNSLTGFEDFFLTKYNSSGTKLYTKQLGVSGEFTDANSVAVDSSGNVFVAGTTTGGLDGNTLTGTTDFFVVKYDAAGNKQ